MRGAEGHSSMTVHIIPEGYDRLPEPAPRRDSIFDTPKSAAAFRAQVQHSGFVREPAAAGSALRDDDEAQQESWPREQRSRGHLRGLLLSRGCASLSTVVVLTALAVTAQQLIEHHDFRAVRHPTRSLALSTPSTSLPLRIIASSPRWLLSDHSLSVFVAS